MTVMMRTPSPLVFTVALAALLRLDVLTIMPDRW
jgi:hypothetical protein